MSDHQDKLDKLLSRLEILLNQQEQFSREVNTLRAEINQLKGEEATQSVERGKAETEGETSPVSTGPITPDPPAGPFAYEAGKAGIHVPATSSLGTKYLAAQIYAYFVPST